MSTPRKPYPSDVTGEEWAFVAPYLTPMTLAAPQRKHDLREVLNVLRWLARTGSPWRYLPNDLPPWPVVYQQTQRWPAAGCFEAVADDLRALLRVAAGRDPEPTAVILDGRTLRSTPESGRRAGYDGHKRTKDSKLHAAVDTLGHLLAARCTPANEQERAQVEALAAEVQEVTGNTVEVAFVDQGDTGEEPAEAAEAHGIELRVVSLPETKKGFVLRPRRWVIERSFAWAAHCRRLAKDYERLPETVVGPHFVAFACLMLHRAAALLGESPYHALAHRGDRAAVSVSYARQFLVHPPACQQDWSSFLRRASVGKGGGGRQRRVATKRGAGHEEAIVPSGDRPRPPPRIRPSRAALAHQRDRSQSDSDRRAAPRQVARDVPSHRSRTRRASAPGGPAIRRRATEEGVGGGGFPGD